MSYTEFYADSVLGNNLNAGSNEGPPKLLITSGNWNGTTTYTATGLITGLVGTDSGNAFASVFPLTSPSAVYIARVENYTANNIILSTTAKTGTAPTSGDAQIRVGGAFKGPDVSGNFPFAVQEPGFCIALINSSGWIPRLNMKYNVGVPYRNGLLSSCQHSLLGPFVIQGYTNVPGDQINSSIKTQIQGKTTGTSTYLLKLNTAVSYYRVCDLEFYNNGTSLGTETQAVYAVGYGEISRCIFHDLLGQGLRTDTAMTVNECEVYRCNLSNTSNYTQFYSGGTTYFNKCISHHPSGTTTCGIYTSLGTIIDSCILYGHPKTGIRNGANSFVVKNTDFYQNVVADIDTSTSNCVVYIENCNFIGCSGYNIESTLSFNPFIVLNNCGFGSGNMAAISGKFHNLSGAIIENNSIFYPSGTTPWINPNLGDFRLNSSYAMGQGRGSFLQSTSMSSGSLSLPSIGSNQPYTNASTVDVNNVRYGIDIGGGQIGLCRVPTAAQTQSGVQVDVASTGVFTHTNDYVYLYGLASTNDIRYNTPQYLGGPSGLCHVPTTVQTQSGVLVDVSGVGTFIH
jgi:hypothetical protein